MVKYAASAGGVLLILLLFFFSLNNIPLWSSDEGRYGEIAREMFESHDFVHATFNYVEYLEKPVLAPILTTLAYSFFGISSWTARLPSVVFGLMGILLCFMYTRKLFDQKAAVFSAAVLSTSIIYVLVGRFAVIDMIMTFWMSSAVLSLMAAYWLQNKKFYLAAYFFMGFGFLAKGLIGIVLPFMIFFIFLAWVGNISEIQRMMLGWAFVIIMAMIAPWMTAMCVKEPEFFNEFIVKHHFARTISATFGRERPFWFFLPIVFGVYFPWALFLPSALAAGLQRSSGNDRNKIKFLFCWFAVILVFFSIPRSKLAYYVVPMSMPIAIMIGWFFSRVQVRFEKPVYYFLLAIVTLGLAGGNIYMALEREQIEILILRPIVQLGSCWVLAGASLAVFYRSKERRDSAFFSLVFMMFGALLITIVCMKELSPLYSSYEFAEWLKPRFLPGDQPAIFSSPDHFSDFPFHLRRRVIVVGHDRGTLSVESSEPEHSEEMKSWFMQEQELVHTMNSGLRPIYCLMESDRLATLVTAGLKRFEVVKQGHGKVLIYGGGDRKIR